MSKFYALAFHVSMTVITMAAVVLAVFIYWLMWPREPVSYLNNPFPVLNSPVQAGNVLMYEVNFCRRTDVPVVVTRELINDSITTLPTLTSRFEEGCSDGPVVIARDLIPNHVSPGDYYLLQTVSLRLNPLRTVNVTVRTENFEVIE